MLLAILPKPLNTLQVKTHLCNCSDNSRYMYKGNKEEWFVKLK